MLREVWGRRDVHGYLHEAREVRDRSGEARVVPYLLDHQGLPGAGHEPGDALRDGEAQVHHAVGVPSDRDREDEPLFPRILVTFEEGDRTRRGSEEYRAVSAISSRSSACAGGTSAGPMSSATTASLARISSVNVPPLQTSGVGHLTRRPSPP
jgi:hypothetical protein